MSFLTALLCSQALFVERFDAPVVMPEWSTAAWNTRGGTYLYEVRQSALHTGAAGVAFTKTDAGPGNFVSPTFLGHPQVPSKQGLVALRYWVRFSRGTGPNFIWPLQVHDVQPFGTVAELVLRPLGDGGSELALQAADSTAFKPAGRALPISAGDWHLFQLDLAGLGTDAGTLTGALDGEFLATIGGLAWEQAQVSRLLLGFGAVHDQWRGSFDLDDLVMLSERRAVFAGIEAPPFTEVGACTPFALEFFDLDGGLLAPPDVSLVFLESDAGAELFEDAQCANRWPPTGNFVATSTTSVGLRATRPGPLGLSIRSADLFGSGETVTAFVDAGVPDAGRVDAGSPDAGAPDAGAPDGGTPSDFSLGCGCGAAPIELFALALLAHVTARRRRFRR